MKVNIKYSFVMEPVEEWKSRDDFDTALKEFFATKGYETEIVDGEEAGKERIMYLHSEEAKEPEVIKKSRSEIIAELAEKIIRKNKK